MSPQSRTLLLVAAGIYMGALEPLKDGTNGWRKLWKGLGLAAVIYGAAFLLGAALGSKDTIQPLRGVFAATGVAGGGVWWAAERDRAERAAAVRRDADALLDVVGVDLLAPVGLPLRTDAGEQHPQEQPLEQPTEDRVEVPETEGAGEPAPEPEPTPEPEVVPPKPKPPEPTVAAAEPADEPPEPPPKPSSAEAASLSATSV